MLARASNNPLSVLSGIQLCGLPGTLAVIVIVSLFGLGPRGTAVSFRPRNLSIATSLYTLVWISFLFWSQPSLIAPLDAAIHRTDRGVSSEVLRDPLACSYR